MSTPLKVTVMVHAAGNPGTSLVPVYHVSVDYKDGAWEENFATIGQLNAFLTGVRCGLSFRGADLGLSFLPTLSEAFVHNRLDHRRGRPFQLWPEKPIDDED